MQKNHGLGYSYVHMDPLGWDENSAISMGGLCDSYYEYLLKQWIQTGKREH